ncbi:FxsA family membrane protein [Streptomyces meridianus]|uniref:FxsA family protein n=1 Tax=Streptomyces meridianus TaxID=2938945 RepID=A0ABT0XCR9_9ACTN|nr:FxsA family membrane protein [Streptomyces meridianus]MCM2580317.1 FxsA family protein [Streptomyces meridianus]
MSSRHRPPDPPLPPGGEQPPRRTRRSSPRSFAPLAVAAWVVAEIWILLAVADVAGGWTVLLLLAAGFVLGGIVVKRAGLRAWRRLAENVQAAGGRSTGAAGPRQPERGNALAMLGGVLIMIPGLLSDVAGLLCLFPPTAALIRSRTERSLERRMKGAVPGSLEDSLRQARMHRPDGKVVQGEVIREDEKPDDDGPPASP